MSGESLGAWALTENRTGSDALRMDTTALKKDDKWVLNGTKNWITHGISSEIIVVMARTGEKGDSYGISVFVVERSNPGLKFGKKENKLGMRASETSEIILDNCVLDESCMLGNEARGLYPSNENFRWRKDFNSCFIIGYFKRGISSKLKLPLKKKSVW